MDRPPAGGRRRGDDPKPYDEDRLLVVLHAALTMGAGPDADPLYSDLAAQDGIEPLLAAFCKRVQQVLGDLHKLTAAGNVSEVRHACVGLRGSAGGYGFASITAAAADAVKALDAAATSARPARRSTA